MRKKHQSVLISSVAKKNLCNEISLGNYTYESEVKEQLRDFFNNNIQQEDVENIEENSQNCSDDDSFEVSNIKVPKQIINNQKEFAKFQISEKAILGGIDPFNYETIPQKDTNSDNNKDSGDSVKFFDIIKQCIFWKDKNETKGKKGGGEIEPFELFNLNPDKIKIVKEKINEFKKIAKDKKLDASDSVLHKFLTELENNYVEQKKELNNLISNLENVDTIEYGKNWCEVGFLKTKIANQNDTY